jgi:hypothetical protein
MFPVFARRSRCNADNGLKDWPNAGRGRRPHDIMRVYTQRAIRVSCSVCMSMSKLDRGAEQQKNGQENDVKDASLGIRCPGFGAQYHKLLINIHQEPQPTNLGDWSKLSLFKFCTEDGLRNRNEKTSVRPSDCSWPPPKLYP